MSKRIAVAGGASLVATIFLSIVPAQTETLYFGGSAGWTLLQNQKIEAAGLPTTTARFDSGFAAGARIGYEEGSWRFEAEYTYRRNELDKVTVGGASLGGVDGSRQAHAFLANLIYEIDFGWPVKPHIGGGIGGVYLKDKASVPGIVTLNDNGWEIGYQGIAGLRYDVTRNIAVDLDYRYFATTDDTLPRAGEQQHL